MHENWHGGFHTAELPLRQQWRAKMPSRFGDWAKGLSTQDKSDLATSIDFLLRVLEHTGLKQKNQTLSMFALGSSRLSHGIAFSYNTTPSSNRWAHMLQDSEIIARRLGYEVLREKQQAECGGEEVLIFGERAWTE